MSFSKYQDFVQLKAAPFHQISVEEFDLLHTSLGLATELLELELSRSRENTIEECGDLLWYFTLGTLTLGIKAHTMLGSASSDQGQPLPMDNLTCHIEAFISEVKKAVIYKQERDIMTPFLTAWVAFTDYLSACNIPLNQLIKENMAKLEKRYAEAFTTDESELRKDK